MREVGKTWREWDFAAGTEAYELALDADPNRAQAAAYFAHHPHIVGRGEEGAAMFQRALELDPDDGLVQALYGMELMYEGRFDFAVERMKEVLRVTPNDPIALSTLRTAQGHPERAAALELGRRAGGYPGALRAVAELMREQSRQGTYVTPWQIGTLYTRAGDEEKALDFLEQAYEVHDPNMPYIAVDPIFDFTRGNPRFTALIRRLGLPG